MKNLLTTILVLGFLLMGASNANAQLSFTVQIDPSPPYWPSFSHSWWYQFTWRQAPTDISLDGAYQINGIQGNATRPLICNLNVQPICDGIGNTNCHLMFSMVVSYTGRNFDPVHLHGYASVNQNVINTIDSQQSHDINQDFVWRLIGDDITRDVSNFLESQNEKHLRVVGRLIRITRAHNFNPWHYIVVNSTNN